MLRRLIRTLIMLAMPLACLSSISNVTLSNGSSFVIFQNGELQPLFNGSSNPLSCTEAQTLILQQTPAQLAANTPYTISITSNGFVSASISTLYGRFSPTVSPSECVGSCTITVWNNCPTIATSSNYFDVLTLQMSNLPAATYRVWCDQSYRPNTFQWGLFLIILLATILISVSAVYSRAWSIGGNGIKINYWIVGACALLWIAGGLMGAFIPKPTYVIVLVLSWIIGLLAIIICCNEILWLFKCEALNKAFVWWIRPIDCISLAVSLGVMMSWWFGEFNWISSDIIGICTVVAFIKCFKFTTMQMAVLLLMVILGLEIIAALIIYYVVGQSYNTILLNNFNNPMFIQLPTLGVVLNQQCAWLPVTEIIFPGIFISYLRRYLRSDSDSTIVVTQKSTS